MKRLTFVVVLGWALLLAAAAARATTFIPMSVEDLTRSSVAVAVGTVTRLTSVQTRGGALATLVAVAMDEVVKGMLPAGTITLKEDGGTVSGRSEVVFGAPRFAIGERVLLFLTMRTDGSLRTNHLALGKFRIDIDATGMPQARQQFDAGAMVLIPPGVATPSETIPLGDLLRAIRQVGGGGAAAGATVLRTAPAEAADTTLPKQATAPFVLNRKRFFEPDEGTPLNFLIDQAGDSILGLTSSRQAVDDAFAAWTNVAEASITFEDGGLSPALTGTCPASNAILFDDPEGTIPDPFNCHGTLGVGSACSSSFESKTFSGRTFDRALRGKVTFANGWNGCALWTSCNLAEIATHEIGHVIGLGHSSEREPEPNADLRNATMYFRAHFDGRCAGLRTDDINGVSVIYPTALPPTITTPTDLPPGTSGRPYAVGLDATAGAGTFTWSLVGGGFSGLSLRSDGIMSGTPDFGGRSFFQIKATDGNGDSHTKVLYIAVTGPTATRTATFTRTPAATVTPTASATPTATSTATPTETPTVTPTTTPTDTPSPTPTFTDTPTPTDTPTSTPSPTLTPSPTATSTLTPTATAPPTPAPTPLCVGDCDHSGEVTVNEILTMVNVALGAAPAESCAAGDTNHDGSIIVDEILTAVNAALHGCPSAGGP